MTDKAHLWDDPFVRHRLQVGGYARIHGNISQTARHFGHARKTVRAYLERYMEFERTGDLAVFLNRPRGDPQRTAAKIEELVMAYYQEEDTQRTCPNIARELATRHGITISRQTVYNILRRCGVWVSPRTQRPQPITRFEATRPNALWQGDLIELADTCLGKVYATVILDDHARYLLGLRFAFTKGQEGVLYAFYLAFCAVGLPAEVLVDRGGQFYATADGAISRFQQALERLGVTVHFTSRAQTKGKVEKLIQFIERDFLNVTRNRVTDLDALNAQAECWRVRYNARAHEGIHTAPERRYRPSPHQVSAETVWEAFAVEERRKIYRDATIHMEGQHYAVPEQYVGESAWVRTFYDRLKVCIGAENTVIAVHHGAP